MRYKSNLFKAPLSYMALETVPEAYLEFDIEISFKPEAANGNKLSHFKFT